MKRLVVLFVAIVPLCLFVAGCGNTGSPSGKTEMTGDQKEKMKAAMKAEMEQSLTKKPMMDKMMQKK